MARRIFNSTLDFVLASDGGWNSTLAAYPDFDVLRQDIDGTSSSETLDGTEDDDVINGFGGDDIINGLGGNDILNGGSGTNTFTGGAGNDTFVFGRAATADGATVRGSFNTTVTDFTQGEDRIDLTVLNVESLAILRPFMRQDIDDVVIELNFTTGFSDPTEFLRIENVDLFDLTDADFIFSTDTSDLTISAPTNGGDGRDNTIFGGVGNDTITGGRGDDTFIGGSGNDILSGGSRNDTLDGGIGDDTLDGGTGINALTGGDGADIFVLSARGQQNTTIMDFEQGEDRIDLTALNVENLALLLPFMRQDIDDVVLEINFTTGFTDPTEILRIEDVDLFDLTDADFIFSTDASDLDITAPTNGGDGRDNTIFGGAGNDTITGGRGDDTFIGGSGNDELSGGSSNDILDGGLGDDELNGGTGVNTLTGGDGADDFNFRSRGQQNTTITDFTQGEDTIDLRAFNVEDLATLLPFITQDGADAVITTAFTTGFTDSTETIRIENVQVTDLTEDDFQFSTDPSNLTIVAPTNGGEGRDNVIFGGTGDDTITGGRGDDTFVGGSGDDELSSGSRNDVLDGGAGDDELDGGTGVNVLTGGDGADDFNIRSRGQQNTTITDFVQGEDSIDLRVFNVENLATLLPFMTQDGDDVLITTNFTTGFIDPTETIRIQNVLLADLTDDDFQFSRDPSDLTITAPTNGGGNRANTIFGGAGDDAITGGRGADTFVGGTGDDTLSGGDANDVLDGGAGADVLIGGDGFDRASYAGSAEGVTINLTTGELIGSETVGDTFDSIEGVTGSAFDDVITGGTENAGRYDGLDGNDIITVGANTININIVNGGNGNDIINGGLNEDRLNGDAGDDIFNLVALNDEVDGGEGFDTIVIDGRISNISAQNGVISLDLQGNSSFSSGSYEAVEAIVIDGITFGLNADAVALNLGGVANTLTEGSDFLEVSSSGFVNGAGGNDYIIGDGSSQTISGGSGQDYLFGGGGDDTLSGDISAAADLTPDSIEAQVFRAYVAVLGRNPDLGGFEALVTNIRFGVSDQRDLVIEFVNSAEFQQTYGSLTTAEFVDTLFTNVLPNNTDQNARAAFANRIDNNDDPFSRVDMVLEFTNTPEFVANQALPSAAFAQAVLDVHPDEATIFRIYQAVFNRAPDEGGFIANVDALQGNALTVAEITASFVISEEFNLTYGDLSTTEFVEALFTNVLPGNTDQAGRDAFINRLEGDESFGRAEMVTEFVLSPEFISRQNDAAKAFVAGVFDGSADLLDGGTGNDTLFGGRGADTFVYDQFGNLDGFLGSDTIVDFTQGEDIIEIRNAVSEFDSFFEIREAAAQVGNDVILLFGTFGFNELPNQLVLQNTRLSDLTEDDFVIFAAEINTSAEKPVDIPVAEDVIDFGGPQNLLIGEEPDWVIDALI